MIQAGLRGCGLATALALTNTNLGDRLFNAAISMAPVKLTEFLNIWRLELREELLSNTSGFLSQRAPAAAKAITNDFPSLEILNAYTAPVVSLSQYDLWRKRFDIVKLSKFMAENLNWSEDMILKRLKTQLIGGAVIDHLLESIKTGQDLCTSGKGQLMFIWS